MKKPIKVVFIVFTTRKGRGSMQVERAEIWEENGEIIPMEETIDMGCGTDCRVTIKKMIRESIPLRWHSDRRLSITMPRQYEIRRKDVPPKNVGNRETNTTITKMMVIVVTKS